MKPSFRPKIGENRLRMNFSVIPFAALALLSAFASVQAQEPEHVPPQANDPIASSLSLKTAAQFLDQSAVWWQTKYECCHCHSNMLHLVARPALNGVVKSDGKVRDFFEYLVQERWEKTGLRYEPESLVVAVPLAFHDYRTTGKLHPATRKALDRMISLQRPEGDWTLLAGNGKRSEVAGERKAFFRGFEQTMFAAIGIAVAPEDYAKTPAARMALDRIRAYLQKNPPQTAHQKGMALWASRHVPGLMNHDERKTAIDQLLALQGTDDGWALENIVAGTHSLEHVTVSKDRISDGYATGFVIFVVRQGDFPATDERLQRGLAWLRSHQRVNGAWFVPSFNSRPNHVLSHAGTAFAVLALEACGEIRAQPGD